MKITLFTSNHPRHIALAHDLASVSDELFVVQERAAFFSNTAQSSVMRKYFLRVASAEEAIFGKQDFLPQNVRSITTAMGNINNLTTEVLEPALHSAAYIVFGSSFLKGWLCDFLIERKALNIHMGVSPYYRGSACNFWALYDNRPDLVGATVHFLSKGLDSGSMLFHALPSVQRVDPFLLGMLAVRAAQNGLMHHVMKENALNLPILRQDSALEIRYSRIRDFTDEIVTEYIGRIATPDSIEAALRARNMEIFHNPFVS